MSRKLFRYAAISMVTIIILVQAVYANLALYNGNIQEMWYFIGGMVIVGGGIGLFLAVVEIFVFGGEPDGA